MPLNEFACFPKINGCFIIKNISNPPKTIEIFNTPTGWGKERDLLSMEGIGEADIRASLLKGTLRNKIRNKEIEIICSDIDLLQFNSAHKSFLQSAGIVNGLEVTGSEISSLPFFWKEEVTLLGIKNGTNNIFYTPDKFLNGLFSTGDRFHIHVKHNGRDLYENIDYTIGESDGPGTGYDTINLISLIPISSSQLFATYAIRA